MDLHCSRDLVYSCTVSSIGCPITLFIFCLLFSALASILAAFSAALRSLRFRIASVAHPGLSVLLPCKPRIGLNSNLTFGFWLLRRLAIADGVGLMILTGLFEVLMLGCDVWRFKLDGLVLNVDGLVFRVDGERGRGGWFDGGNFLRFKLR